MFELYMNQYYSLAQEAAIFENRLQEISYFWYSRIANFSKVAYFLNESSLFFEFDRALEYG